MDQTDISTLAAICVIIVAITGALRWIIKGAIEVGNAKLSLLINEQLNVALSPISAAIVEISRELSDLNDKFDDFMKYERENVQEHMNIHGRINDLVVRLNQMEGQQQSISVQLGVAHIVPATTSPSPQIEDQ